MPNQFVASNLRSLPMFAQFPHEALGTLSDYVLVLRVETNEILFHQGETARGLYFVVGGSARLTQTAPDGIERALAVVGANQFLNDAALLRPAPESATLRALETTIVLLLTRENYTRMLTEHPQIRAYLPASLLPSGLPVIPVPKAPPAVPAPAPAPVRQTTAPPTPAPAAAGGAPVAGAAAPPTAPAAAPGTQPAAGPVAGARSLQPAPDTPPKLFREQRDDENILVNTHRHWWAFGRQAWLPGLVAAAIFLTAFFTGTFWLSLALVGIAVLVPGLLMLYFYLEWRNDQVIVTDQRVIRIERTIPTFETKISDIPLSSVQEVNVSESSLFAQFFNFGDVELKTPGDAGNLHLTMIPQPDQFQKLVFEHRARAQEAISMRQRSVLRTEIDHIVAGGSPRAALPTAPKPPEEAIYRKHTLYRVQLMFLPALLLLFAVGLFFASLLVPSLRETVVLPVVAIGLGIVGAGWLYWADWDWRNDLYIVGTETLQIIHRRPLWLHNETEQVSLSKIDSVVSDQNGLFESLFDYGTVKISLLGGDVGSEKAFTFIGEPQEVQAEIARRVQAMRNRGAAEAERRRRAELAEYLSVYHETVGGQQSPPPPDRTPPPPDARRVPPQQPGTEPPMPDVRDHMRPPSVPRPRTNRKP